MALLSGGTLPWIERRFIKVTTAGIEPNSNGYFLSFESGTSTPLETFSDSELTTSNGVRVDFDVDGRTLTQVFLSPAGYKFEVYDSDDVLLYTADDIEDIGQVFANLFGQIQTLGSKNVTSGYTIAPGDRLVTVASTGGPSPCIINLLPAAEFTGMLTIKNVGTEPVDITPAGVQTVDDVAAAYEIPLAASPEFPSVILCSDGVSNYWILASHQT